MDIKKFERRWYDCKDCELCNNRFKVVLWGDKKWGKLGKQITPGEDECDLLFIGEAPGVSEDVVGVPFIGKSGKLLRGVIESLLSTYDFTFLFTNVVCCLPTRQNNSSAPTTKQIKSCNPRLVQFIELVKPKKIVAVGEIAAKTVDYNCKLVHPSFILRMNEEEDRELAIRRCMLQLEETIKTL